MIHVTRSFLPPKAEYEAYLDHIWKSSWLTNRGLLVHELEKKVKDYLNVPQMLAMANGTLPLQFALRLLGKEGEIITTPFSYVASSSSIVWENCKPVFVDIHPDYLCIDETKIESAITAKTTAILATHVFGNPCHVDKIEQIAQKYKLKVIYDGAHAFGVNYQGRSLFTYGDVATCSFHATKIFHTGEGGAFFSNDTSFMDAAFDLHNFGHKDEEEFKGLGINGKLSELQAAMGLAVLPYMDFIREERKKVVKFYQQYLNFSNMNQLKLRAETDWNYSYFPIIFSEEKKLLKTKEALNKLEIFPRRYFYPSLNTISYLKGQNMPVAETIASRILCLPLFVGLHEQELQLICQIINRYGN